jgi:hypothetical protein
MKTQEQTDTQESQDRNEVDEMTCSQRRAVPTEKELVEPGTVIKRQTSIPRTTRSLGAK